MTQQSHSWAYIQTKFSLKKTHAALFTIVKSWKQPKCPSTDDWIRKMWCVYIYIYIHPTEYYSAIKKNEIMPFAVTWMDLEVIILNEVSQTKTNIM